MTSSLLFSFIPYRHGDLKAANVLLTGNMAMSNSCACGFGRCSCALQVWTAAGSPPLTAKVADFGLAINLGPQDTHATMMARVSAQARSRLYTRLYNCKCKSNPSQTPRIRVDTAGPICLLYPARRWCCCSTHAPSSSQPWHAADKGGFVLLRALPGRLLVLQSYCCYCCCSSLLDIMNYKKSVFCCSLVHCL